MKKLLTGTFIILLLSALIFSPAFAAPDSDAAQAAFEQGVTALNQGNTTTALDKFNEAIKLDPDLPEAYINRGIVRMRLDQPVEAVADFDKALELAPDSSEA